MEIVLSMAVFGTNIFSQDNQMLVFFLVTDSKTTKFSFNLGILYSPAIFSNQIIAKKPNIFGIFCTEQYQPGRERLSQWWRKNQYVVTK